ncbi:putative cathepsin E [Roridomyces roridus]|uniref:Cathepsin E n=1 Tax=Roridomyces roridus TaxID=1738132 RepID=A0AAD7FPV8_9AGAR|nr:putative cathepsin E [Roridomyces roridus]
MVRVDISSVLVATAIDLATAQSTITVQLKKINTVTNASHLVAGDYARLRHHHSKHSGNVFRGAISEGSVINEGNGYIAQTKVGSQTFDLLVDTGSSNTWVGAHTKFVPGRTANSTGHAVKDSYGKGNFSGIEYIDAVSVGGIGVKQQSIGVAQFATGFPSELDGILGLGPVQLTNGTVQGVSEVPTFIQNLLSEGVIAQNILGISFAPLQGIAPESPNGVLTFGGVDANFFKGNITYTPRIPPFWGISACSFKFGPNSLGPNSTASYSGFVDTGTTLILLPSPVFTAFLNLTKGSVDPSTGFIAFPANGKPTHDVSFVVGGTTFTMTPEQYLLPETQYASWGITAQEAQASGGYALFGNAETAGAPGFVLGIGFLEFFYSVYDTENDRVGLAPAA